MFRVLYLIFVLRSVSTRKTEEIEDNLVVTNDNGIDGDSDGELTISGNVSFEGPVHAKGSVKIFTSSGGPSAPFQSTWHQAFGNHNVYLNPTTPRFPPPIPALFLSTFSYPIFVPYLATRLQTTSFKPRKLPHILNTLSSITILPKVAVPDRNSDENPACPIVESILPGITLCPKMVVTSPIALKLGQLDMKSRLREFALSAVPSQANLSVKPSLQLFPAGASSSVPIHLVNPTYTVPLGEVNSSNYAPVSNLQFTGVVPVSGRFRIFAKF